MRARPIGVDVEIVEATKNLEDAKAVGVIVPNRLRLNGMEILWPEDHPPVVAPIDFGENAAMVTVTMFARTVTICAANNSLPDAGGTPIYDQLMAEHRATTAPEYPFDSPIWEIQ